MGNIILKELETGPVLMRAVTFDPVKKLRKRGKKRGGVFTFFEAKLTMNFINVVKRCLTAPDVKCVNLLTLQP